LFDIFVEFCEVNTLV